MVPPQVEDGTPVVPPQVGDGTELPPPFEEEAVVPSQVSDIAPGEEATFSGYVLTDEDRAMGVEAQRPAPQPSREWRFLGYPWCIERELEDGRKGVVHQESGLFFPEAMYHTTSKGVDELIRASSKGAKSNLFLRVLGSLPLPRISDKEKETRRKTRIRGEVMDLVVAKGSFSKALGWSANSDYSGVEVDRVTEHLTDVFKNQSSPPRAYSSPSFSIRGKKDFPKALLDSVFSPSKQEFPSYGSQLGGFLRGQKLNLDKVEEARKVLEPNVRALLCNEAVLNVARHASESPDLNGLSKEAMARLLRHIVAFSEEIAASIEPQTSARAMKFLAAKKALRDQVLKGVCPRRIRQALDECPLLDPDIFPKDAFGEVEKTVVHDNVELYRGKADSHSFKRPLSPSARKSSSKAAKLGKGGKHFPQKSAKPSASSTPTKKGKPSQPSASQPFRPGAGHRSAAEGGQQQSSAPIRASGSGVPRGQAATADAYHYHSGGARNRTKPHAPYAGGRGGYTSQFAIRREQ